MREYRGKQVDNGKWVYGSLWKVYAGKCYILDENSNITYRPSNYYAQDVEGIFEVVPETVGQSTGLKDKDFWQGDILQSKDKLRKYESMK